VYAGKCEEVDFDIPNFGETSAERFTDFMTRVSVVEINEFV
jgi:hypothetical protein